MFQREVAERLVAAPRSPAYGRLSVLVQWLTEPQILFDLPPRAFVPPPKVISSVVHADAARRAAGPGRQAGARTRHRRRLRPAPQDAAIEPQAARRPGRGAARRGRNTANGARRGSFRSVDFCALARAFQTIVGPDLRLQPAGIP